MQNFGRPRPAGHAHAPPGKKDTDFSSLYAAGAVLCYLLAFLPFAWMPFAHSIPHFGMQMLMLFGLLFCGVLGYCLQSLTGILFHIVRLPVGSEYEDAVRHRYKIYQAVLVHLAAVPVFWIAKKLTWMIFRQYADTWNDSSALPLFCAVGAVLMLEIGGVLWFFPFHSLICVRQTIVFFVLFLINFYLSFMIRSPQVKGLPAVDVFLLCLSVGLFILLLNQSFLTRKYHGKTARGVNDNAKRYSMQIVLAELGLILAGSVVMMALIVALVSLWKLFVQFLVTTNKKYVDVEDVQKELSADVTGKLLKMEAGEVHSWMILFYILFFACLFLLIVALIPSLREKAKQFLAYLREIIPFLFRPFSEWKKYRKKKTVVQVNYVDTVETTRRPRQKSFASAEHTGSYAAFQKKLETLPTTEEKIRYAYAVLAAQLRNQNCQVRASDTPRELTVKVRKRNLISDIGELTEAFEQIRYAEHPVPEETADAVLRRLCVLAETYLF